jgi:hypothetical protein
LARKDHNKGSGSSLRKCLVTDEYMYFLLITLFQPLLLFQVSF